MTKAKLQHLKNAAGWGGVIITCSGIVVNLVQSKNWIGNGIALFGLVIVSVGFSFRKAEVF